MSRYRALARRFLYEVFVILVAFVVVLVGLRAYLQLRPRVDAQAVEHAGPVGPVIGSTFTAKSVDLTKFARTFVLLTSPSCIYCKHSMPFHVRLQQSAHSNGVGFLLSVPKIEGARDYLLNFQGAPLVEWGAINVPVRATPMLLLVEKGGTIKNIWVGQLPPSTEDDLINSLTVKPSARSFVKDETSPVTSIQDLSFSDLKREESVRKLQLINVAERGGATSEATVHIPLGELALRAPYELDSRFRQVIDCSNIRTTDCQAAAARLKEQGFNVATFNASNCTTCAAPMRRVEESK